MTTDTQKVSTQMTRPLQEGRFGLRHPTQYGVPCLPPSMFIQYALLLRAAYNEARWQLTGYNTAAARTLTYSTIMIMSFTFCLALLI